MMKVAVQQGQNAAVPAQMSIIRLTWINVTKDLRLEWRSRDVFNSMMFFALVVVVVFSFSFEREDSRPVMGGLIWIAFLFSTTMALNQSWARELRNGVLDARGTVEISGRILRDLYHGMFPAV
jgi:ABC-type transport system involved in cytochrome c biogenesis permease component